MLLALLLALAATPQGTVTIQSPALVVRATVPLPRGSAWDERLSPVSLIAPDGTRCPTQWERVTDWPGTDHVRVAEILAQVPPASGAVTYTVAPDPQRDARADLTPYVSRWLSMPPGLDVDAQPIAAHVLRDPVRSGRVAQTVRFHGRHFVGWLTGYAGIDAVELILIVHNGEARSPVWYFDELAIPGVGGVESVGPEPVLAVRAGRLVLVPARTDGKANFLEQRGWRRWHLWIHDGSQAALARRMADGAGWGVSDQWQAVGAYQPHALPLPPVSPKRRAELQAKAASDWTAIRSALAAGTPYGMGATSSSGTGRVGFRHAWGQFYGGVTGGGYRFQWAGLEVALTGSPAGLLELDARFRMVADRQPIIACNRRGFPLLYEDWLTPDGKPKGGWRISATDGRFDFDGGAAGLGWSTAKSGVDPARIPAEQATLAKYAPIDWQHHDRAHQPAVSLAWLANDPSAKWALEQYAELWRWRESSRLPAALTSAQARPGLGTDYGRDSGHGYTVAAAAYALGDDGTRQRLELYLRGYVDMLAAARMPNGLWQQRAHRKEAKVPPFGTGTVAQWAICKGTEDGLMSGAVAAIGGTVPGLRAETHQLLRAHAVEGLWRFLWHSGATGGAPTNYIGVRPVIAGRAGPPSTDPALVPRDGWDSEEVSAALGYAAWADIAADGAISPEVRAAIRRYCGGAADSRAWLDARSLYALKLDDVAPMRSALERAP
jgi:hypothetical protein